MAQSNVDRYRRWFTYEQDAHSKVLASLATVPTEKRTAPEFRKAVNLFAHVVAGRRVWLARLSAAPVPLDQLFPENASLEESAAQWRSVSEQWVNYLARADDAELARVCEYQSFDAGRFRTQIEDILTQLFSHSSYHRGQIAMLVRAAGGQPATTDFIYWCREAIGPG